MADCKLAGVCFGNLEMPTFLDEKMDVIREGAGGGAGEAIAPPIFLKYSSVTMKS